MIKSSETYIYQSIHLSIALRLYVFATLALLVILFVLKVALWVSPLISTSILGMIYLANLGIIQLSSDGSILIQDRRRRIKLSSIDEKQSWWHYIHRGKAIANDVHVILLVKDTEGQEVYFSETIMFDTRHPNEVPFRNQHIPEESTVIRVQRVDRLMAFLEDINPHKKA